MPRKIEEKNKLIAERVHFYRRTRDISLEALGSALRQPLTAQQMSRYERGECRWPCDLLCEVAQLLAVDVRILLCMEDAFRERKDSPNMDAERYKVRLLKCKPRVRAMIYQLIDSGIEL